MTVLEKIPTLIILVSTTLVAIWKTGRNSEGLFCRIYQSPIYLYSIFSGEKVHGSKWTGLHTASIVLYLKYISHYREPLKPSQCGVFW